MRGITISVGINKKKEERENWYSSVSTESSAPRFVKEYCNNFQLLNLSTISDEKTPLLSTTHLNALFNRLKLVYLSPKINIWLFFFIEPPIQSKKKYSYKGFCGWCGGPCLGRTRSAFQLVWKLTRRVINVFSSTAKCFCNLIYICRDATCRCWGAGAWYWWSGATKAPSVLSALPAFLHCLLQMLSLAFCLFFPVLKTFKPLQML